MSRQNGESCNNTFGGVSGQWWAGKFRSKQHQSAADYNMVHGLMRVWIPDHVPHELHPIHESASWGTSNSTTNSSSWLHDPSYEQDRIDGVLPLSQEAPTKASPSREALSTSPTRDLESMSFIQYKGEYRCGDIVELRVRQISSPRPSSREWARGGRQRAFEGIFVTDPNQKISFEWCLVDDDLIRGTYEMESPVDHGVFDLSTEKGGECGIL